LLTFEGTAKLHGSATVSHFNDTFKHETLFLAQELDCSEIFCAELIDNVAVVDKLGRSATAESAVVRLHEERASLLQCLRRILEGAMNPTSLSPRVATMLSKYAVDLMTVSFDFGNGRGNGRLAEKMTMELDRLRDTIEKTRVSLTNAPSATTSK
jgi:nuclear pore complex protein Nup205